MKSEAFSRYIAAKNAADSVKAVESQVCEVIEGSNDGFYIFAFGWQYRYACVNDPVEIAKLFVDIVSVGPVEVVA